MKHFFQRENGEKVSEARVCSVDSEAGDYTTAVRSNDRQTFLIPNFHRKRPWAGSRVLCSKNRKNIKKDNLPREVNF